MTRPLIRVLLVEDDAVDRMACRRALSRNADYEFLLSEADSGREGLQLAHEQKPDCVLLDYHLPDLNGLEFLAALADDTGVVSVPVMMLTGTDNATIAVEAMKRGARDYLIKDTEHQYLELLPAVIQRVLSERRMLKSTKPVAMASEPADRSATAGVGWTCSGHGCRCAVRSSRESFETSDGYVPGSVGVSPCSY